jgi:hypothetical protein
MTKRLGKVEPRKVYAARNADGSLRSAMVNYKHGKVWIFPKKSYLMSKPIVEHVPETWYSTPVKADFIDKSRTSEQHYRDKIAEAEFDRTVLVFLNHFVQSGEVRVYCQCENTLLQAYMLLVGSE